jgi:mono/diheme cytochrome c family protein
VGRAFIFGLWISASIGVTVSSVQPPTPAAPAAMFDKYCVSCHNQRLRTAGFAIDNLDSAHPAANPEAWEKVIAKLRAGSMPPPGRPRPDPATYRAVASALEQDIDRAWLAKPNPGRIIAVHRLNRTEYNNAIRDLFALDVDVKPLLPGDETADGSFDNMADALSISTAHLERYMSVARQVTRLATGLPPTRPTVETFEIPLHVMQDERQSEDLPFGSRGGMAIRHDFPSDGEYAIKVRLQRQYQDYIKGMGWPQQLDVRLDHKLVKRFTVGGDAKGRPAASSYAGDGEPGFAGDDSWEKYMQIGGDAGLEVRVPVAAGPHVVGVAFVRQLWEPEGLPQPLQRGRVITDDQVYMGYANVGSVQIGGPYQLKQERQERQERQEGSIPPIQPIPPGHATTDTPSRRAVFVCQPASAAEEKACATRILSRMARLAYRRPATPQSVQTLLEFFDKGRSQGGNFDTGIQFALERMLVDPDFLLRLHTPSRASHPSSVLSDLEIASRLSFFLWGSIPDDRLLTLAERGQLTSSSTLDKEVRRMLADPRASESLVNDFAAQWLNLRRVDEVVVDPERYPNYDLSLLQGFQRETELFVGSTIHEDRSVVALLNADYTFVNERLARHYGIPGIYGSRFRRVTLPNPDQRGGLLAQGALLATTSYPDRTSPVLRGKWLLNNIFGLPVPPPPPGVDQNLPEGKPGAAPPSIRERLAQHRASPSCASCHATIDPLGFALENFDVIGGWRTVDESGRPVDASGQTVSGAKVQGLAGLRALLLEQPDQFPRTVTEKLLAYAIGRPLEYSDRPAVRSIVREAAAHDYRWSSIILGITQSPTFLMRIR